MRQYSPQEIRQLLEKNDNAVCRGLVRIYERQTQDEQSSETTKYHNKVGFSAFDAHILSNMAAFYIKKGFLTKSQLAFVRKQILKYSKQLADIANQLQMSKEVRYEN